MSCNKVLAGLAPAIALAALLQAGATSASPAATPAKSSPGTTAVPREGSPAIDGKLKEGTRKAGSLLIVTTRGDVVGNVVQLPLMQHGAAGAGDTLDRYFIASSRNGYLFSWPDGGKVFLGGGSYYSDEGCTGRRFVRYELLPHAARYLGAVFEEGGKVWMVPPDSDGMAVVRSYRDGASCVDSYTDGAGLAPVLPNVPSVSGVPDTAPFSSTLRLSAQ